MLFRTIRKRRAIAAYATQLPRLLLRDYGPAQTYTPAQIKRTLERGGLSTDFDCYALAMFSDSAQFDAYHQAAGKICAYEPMRAEIADAHFGGNAHFTFIDLTDSFSSGDADGAHHSRHGH